MIWRSTAWVGLDDHSVDFGKEFAMAAGRGSSNYRCLILPPLQHIASSWLIQRPSAQVTVICVRITHHLSKKHNKSSIRCRTKYDSEEDTSDEIRSLTYTYEGQDLGHVNRCAAAEKNTEMQEKRVVNSYHISKSDCCPGGMTPSEWTHSVRAVRDTPVSDYSAPGVNWTRCVPYRPLIAVSPFLLVLLVSYSKWSLWHCGQLWPYIGMGSLGTRLHQDCNAMGDAA